MHPVNWLPSRDRVCRLARLPNSAGISPVNCQLVAGEEQSLQVGEIAQLRRYRPGQLVVVEGQQFQVGEIAQLRRYLEESQHPGHSAGISPVNWLL